MVVPSRGPKQIMHERLLKHMIDMKIRGLLQTSDATITHPGNQILLNLFPSFYIKWEQMLPRDFFCRKKASFFQVIFVFSFNDVHIVEFSQTLPPLSPCVFVLEYSLMSVSQ